MTNVKYEFNKVLGRCTSDQEIEGVKIEETYRKEFSFFEILTWIWYHLFVEEEHEENCHCKVDRA